MNQVLCVTCALKDSDLLSVEDGLLELSELCRTLGLEVQDKLILSSSQIFAPTYISRPMAEELAMTRGALDSEIVVFNNDLSPAQVRNLEKILDCAVMDRTEVILKIFQIHARTQEAKLQVEIAQLKYTLPRLKRMWLHLSRIEGGVVGYSSKGPGEKQIELDRRYITNRIAKLSKKLKQIDTRRETRRHKRVESALPLVSLVGYTNAGKTTLLNVLAKEKLLAEDKLFATLSPVTRKVYLFEQEYALVSDTVGFIKDLPHHLVASFHTTLQEIEYADIILLLQDISHRNYQEQIKTVTSILGELKVLDKPVLLVFSKIDLLEDNTRMDQLAKAYPEALFISARDEAGLVELKKAITSTKDKLGK